MTLKVDVVENTSGGPVTLTDQSAAKAFLYYNQSSNSVVGSFNISSVSDNATGRFTTSYTSNMANANYSATGMTHVYHIAHDSDDIKTTSGEKYEVYYVSGTGGQRSKSDRTHNCVAIHGDLA